MNDQSRQVRSPKSAPTDGEYKRMLDGAAEQVSYLIDRVSEELPTQFILAVVSLRGNIQKLCPWIEQFSPATCARIERLEGELGRLSVSAEKAFSCPEARQAYRESRALIDGCETNGNTNGLAEDVMSFHCVLERLQEVLNAFKGSLDTSEESDHPRPRGVTLMQAAMMVNDGDRELAKQTKKRWHNSGRLPKPIGVNPARRQEHVYAPSAMAAFLEKSECGLDLAKAQWKKRLTGIAFTADSL